MYFQTIFIEYQLYLAGVNRIETRIVRIEGKDPDH